jgi:hypothetical protein
MIRQFSLWPTMPSIIEIRCFISDIKRLGGRMETKSAVWLRLLETSTMPFQKINMLLSVLICTYVRNTSLYYLYVVRRHLYVRGIWRGFIYKYGGVILWSSVLWVSEILYLQCILFLVIITFLMEYNDRSPALLPLMRTSAVRAKSQKEEV